MLTGYSVIDDQLSGLHCGDLVAVIGESGSGKTSFLANVALNVADQSKQSVLFYSFQHPATHLVLRMICMKGKTSAHRVIRGRILKEEWNAVLSAAGKLREAPLLIDDRPVEAVDSMLASMRRRRAIIRNLKLVMIDSIDMLAGGDMVRYNKCLRKLKAMAMELHIPIVFSTFMRKDYTKAERKNAVSWEKMQSTETYADIIMHMRIDAGDLLVRYNDIYGRIASDINRRQKLLSFIPEIYMARRAEFAVIKNTYGPKGSIFLTFIPQQFRFESDDTAEQDAEP